MATRPILPAALICMTLALSACGTTGEQPEDMAEGGGEVVGGAGTTGTGTGAGTAGDGTGASAEGAGTTGGLSAQELLQEPDSPLSDRIVYFEFDSSRIEPEYSRLLQAHGEFLAEHPQVSVSVEGHTDERGSREYNLALGERRARAVAQVLTLNGASDEQIDVVSFGEEQPAALGSSEDAWAQNRRAELVYRQ